MHTVLATCRCAVCLLNYSKIKEREGMEESLSGELSNISTVSSVSVASSVHQPRPPDGPKPARQAFQAVNQRVVRSPYLATSTPKSSTGRKLSLQRSHAQAKKPLPQSSLTVSPSLVLANGLLPAKYSVRSRWKRAVKQGGWVVAEQGHLPSSGLTLSNVVDAAVKQTRKRSHSSTAASIHRDSGDLCDLREEMRSVRGDLVRVGRERDGALVRVRVVEGELVKKQKMIEDLLASGHITSRDATRSLVGKTKTSASGPSSAPSSAGHTPSLISSLRLKVVRLEQVVREKEREVERLGNHVRVSRVKEAEEERDVYFREICRLTALLRQTTSDAGALKEAELRSQHLESARDRLSGKVRQLEDQCNRLRGDLEKSLQTNPPEPITHNEQGLRGSIADRYVDHRRSQLLSSIVDLELKCQEQEAALSSLCREVEEKQSLHDSRVRELAASHRDALARVAGLEKTLRELTASRDKARRVVRRLKDDRTHYRQLSEKKQSELNAVQCERDRLLVEKKARDHAQKLADRRRKLLSPDPRSRHRAAAFIQRAWRQKRAQLRQNKFQEKRDRATLALQNVVRAHLSRKQLLNTSSTSSPHPHAHQTTPTHETTPTGNGENGREQEVENGNESSESVAIETVQNALRGHLARKDFFQDGK